MRHLALFALMLPLAAAQTWPIGAGLYQVTVNAAGGYIFELVTPDATVTISRAAGKLIASSNVAPTPVVGQFLPVSATAALSGGDVWCVAVPAGASVPLTVTSAVSLNGGSQFRIDFLKAGSWTYQPAPPVATCPAGSSGAIFLKGLATGEARQIVVVGVAAP